MRLAGNWKPITLQYPVLLSFIIISLSLIAILEVLHHFSNGDNGGGLAFEATVDDLSVKASFFLSPSFNGTGCGIQYVMELD